MNSSNRHFSSVEYVLQFFEYTHLPRGDLQVVSSFFHDTAHNLLEWVDDNPETTVALRKLLEAKDAAVRAALISKKVS